MSSGSEASDRSSDPDPVASRRSGAAAAADRPRRRKAKRSRRRSPSYLSLGDRHRDRERVRDWDWDGVRRSRSPSRRRGRRYFDDDHLERRSRSRSPSPVRRRRAISDSDRDDEEPYRRGPSPRRRRRAISDSDDEEPDRRGPSPRRGPAAPRSCRSRSRTRSEECEDRLCCRRSRSPGDRRDGARSVSPPPEEDFYLRIDRSDDLFKCAHCFKLLSSPVYECVDGHVTCAVCHGRTNEEDGDGADRCSRCDSTEYRRSRAIAGWLKSILFPCDNHGYGCPAFVPRHDLEAHERTCRYAPVFCPADWRCDFPGGPTDALERHVTAVHGWAVVDARYGEPVHVRARPAPPRSLLRAEDGALFYLCAKQADHHGGAVKLSMIHIRPDDDAAPPGRRAPAQFTYEVKTPAAATGMQHRIHMQSTVWGTSLRDGVLYAANPVSVKVPGSMLPTEGPQQDSVEVRIVKVAPAAAAASRV